MILAGTPVTVQFAGTALPTGRRAPSLQTMRAARAQQRVEARIGEDDLHLAGRRRVRFLRRNHVIFDLHDRTGLIIAPQSGPPPRRSSPPPAPPPPAPRRL